MKTCVLITCYNEGDLLLNAIRSVKSQQKAPDELIVVNDCSMDERTNDICKNLERELWAKVIYHAQNLGLSGARNTGISEATADVIIPLDADDELPPEAIEEVYNQLNGSNEIDFVFGNYVRRDIRKNLKKETIVDVSGLADDAGNLDKYRLAKNWILLGASPFRKRLWETLNGYSVHFSNNLQDKDFWMRAMILGAKGKNVSKEIYIWNRQDTGMNSTLSHKDHIELQSVNYSFFSSYESPELLPQSDVLYLLMQYKSPKFFCDQFVRSHFYSIKLTTFIKYIFYSLTH